MSATAFAGTEVTDTETLLELLKPVYQAILAGQYWAAAALGLVFAVGLVKRYAAPKVPFLRTDAGGTLMTFVASFGGAVATALLAGSLPSLALVYPAVVIAFVASGGYAAVKRLAVPVFELLARKSPPWLGWVFLLVPRLFDLLTGGDSAIKAAEKAGKDAVKANVSTGAGGVVGQPRDIP